MKSPETVALKRELGLFALIVYGVGDILGAGIYALVGEIAGIAGAASASVVGGDGASGDTSPSVVSGAAFFLRFPKSMGAVSVERTRRPSARVTGRENPGASPRACSGLCPTPESGAKPARDERFRGALHYPRALRSGREGRVRPRAASTAAVIEVSRVP